jgi:copper transporter 1
MKGMPGCGLETATKSSPFVIYSTICTDMPSMKDCSLFKSQCSNSDNIQCQKNRPIPLPSSSITTKQIYSICKEMAMDGCDVCPIQNENSSYAECDLIGTYSKLCNAMPEMSQCAAWKLMCSSNADLPWCPQQVTGAPAMKMYFHNDIANYILFKSLVPQNNTQYAIAGIVCFLMAVFYEALQVYISFLELKWNNTSLKVTEDASKEAFGLENTLYPISIWRHAFGMSRGIQGITQAFIRGLLRTVSITLSYALMLLSMTFNVGLFIAIVIGFGFGTFVFTPMLKFYLKSADTLQYPQTGCH